MTQTDSHPLPRIEDLLDQMGKAKYFATHPRLGQHDAPGLSSKDCFVTHHGLYEFNVIPFGLKNAPAVFQRLMQQVLRDLNPDDGPAFVSVYIDDLIFSESLEDHVMHLKMMHLKMVLERLTTAHLKLKPAKFYLPRSGAPWPRHHT